MVVFREHSMTVGIDDDEYRDGIKGVVHFVDNILMEATSWSTVEKVLIAVAFKKD